MIYEINKLLQSDSNNIREIAHILYDNDAEKNGLTAEQTDKLAKLLLNIEENDYEAMRKLSFKEGYNEGYNEGKEIGYDDGYDDGKKDVFWTRR